MNTGQTTVMNPPLVDASIRAHGPASSTPLIDYISAEVRQRRPFLDTILRDKGSGTLLAYAATLYRDLSGVTPEASAAICAATSAAGLSVNRAALTQQLQRCASVVTADHHALLSHPTLMQANLFGAAAAASRGLPFHIVLAFGDVPLNNDYHPRGVIWNGEKHNIYGNKHRHACVYGLRAAATEELGKLPAEIQAIIPESVRQATLFSQQITQLNSVIWERSTDQTMPKLVYLQVEDIARELLISAFKDPDSRLSRTLFDPELREAVLKNFSEIPGCWSTPGQTERGTHFFWLRNAAGEMERLTLKGETLVNPKGDQSFALQPEAISAGLQNYQLIPAMFLTFACLMENNLRCLGGFNQNDYLKRMQSTWVSTLQAAGLSRDAAQMAGVTTEGYSTGPLFAVNSAGQPAGLEQFLNQPQAFAAAKANLDKLSLNDANTLGMAQVFHWIVPKKDWPAQFQDLSVKLVAKELGLI